MYQKYNNIITDKITENSVFFRMRENTKKDIFEIISWHEYLSLNWFTELTWNLWYLWNIQDNIPLYLYYAKKINHIPNDDELLNIIRINISFIKNYFRNHVILKNIIRNNTNTDTLKQCIIDIVEPLVMLIEQLRTTEASNYMNRIKNSNDVYEIILNFELLIQYLSTLLNIQETSMFYWQEVEFLDYLKSNKSLHEPQTKYHLQAIKSVFKELNNIKSGIETFLLYWSIAREETRQDSDLLDWILVIQNNVIDNYETFSKSLNYIIKSNQVMLNDVFVKYKHPFHYMFQWDLNSYSSLYKMSFMNNFKPIFGKNVIKIENFFDKDLDYYFGKYAFINTFQKLRNECRDILKNGRGISSFCNELKSFMKKGFFLSALAVNGVFVSEDVCFEEFKKKYENLATECDNVIAVLQNNILSKDDIIKILDFYYITLNHVYNFK